MDCSEPVDDYCDVSENKIFQIPETFEDHNADQFLIEFEVEKTYPIDDDEDEDEDEGMLQLDETAPFVRVEDRKRFTFWAPCPRSKERNLTRERISAMLSDAGVVLHKQESMAEKISARADEIANANKASKVLPISVFISLVACFCYDSDLPSSSSS